MGVDDAGDLFERLQDAGAGLAVDYADDFHLPARVLERGLNLFRLDDTAPFLLQEDNVGAAALHHVRHTDAEESVLADDGCVAGFDDVVDRRLHACRPGTGDGHSHAVLGAKDGAQRALGIVHQLDERGIQVADHGLLHRPVDAWVDIGRAGAEEVARRHVQISEWRVGGVGSMRCHAADNTGTGGQAHRSCPGSLPTALGGGPPASPTARRSVQIRAWRSLLA